jgi:predicted RNA-binding protein (TIGR00451 family)
LNLRRINLRSQKNSLTISTLSECVLAEGKENALGIGLTKMSRDEIRSVNKGIAIDNIHYLNDGLWKLAVLE